MNSLIGASPRPSPLRDRPLARPIRRSIRSSEFLSPSCPGRNNKRITLLLFSNSYAIFFSWLCFIAIFITSQSSDTSSMNVPFARFGNRLNWFIFEHVSAGFTVSRVFLPRTKKRERCKYIRQRNERAAFSFAFLSFFVRVMGLFDGKGGRQLIFPFPEWQDLCFL